MRIYPLIRPPKWLWEHSAISVQVREAEKMSRTAQRAIKTHCLRGHPYEENDYTGARYCKICEKERHQKQRAKK